MIRSLSLYSAGESNSDCKIENLEYYVLIWDCKSMAKILYFQILFQKYEKYCKNQTEECHEMVPFQPLVLEHQIYHHREYGQ